MLISLLLIVPLVGGWERGHCCPSPNQDTSKVTECCQDQWQKPGQRGWPSLQRLRGGSAGFLLLCHFTTDL
jgi:hypothetical protein